MGLLMSELLNDKQKRVLDFLRRRSQSGIPPTVREICRETGIKSTSSVHAVLLKLSKMGYISKDDKASRSIRLEGAVTAESVPVLGVVTAGIPILAVENIEEYIPVEMSLARDKELFALRVRGDSMIDAAILDGDYVICEQTEWVRSGEIVVALMEDEATVKRYVNRDGVIALMPENDAYEPIYPESLQILGRVVALYRKM